VKSSNGYPVHNLDTGLNYTSIQEAIDAPETLSDHTIFVEEGAYYEHVVANKSLSLVGENRSTTIIDGEGIGTVVTITANGVIMNGFTVQNSGKERIMSNSFDAGIRCNAKRCNISNNIILNNSDGISLYGKDSYIRSNEIANNDIGIPLYSGSRNNTLRENYLLDNEWGILISFSSNNTLLSNELYGNRYSFYVAGQVLSDFIHQIDNSNVIDGRSIRYLVGVEDLTIDKSFFGGNIGYLAIINSTNIQVKDFNFTRNGQGLLIAYTQGASLRNITVSNNCIGIHLNKVTNSILCRNNIMSNYAGVVLEWSELNMLTENNIQCNYAGKWNVTAYKYGLPPPFGIGFLDSSNNTIWHNNFVNNTHQVYDSDPSMPSINTWDNSYPSGGNYWSDYNGTDSDNDGIGDHPYEIDKNNTDHFPLMGEFHKYHTGYIEPGFTLTLISNSTISNFVVWFWIEHPEYRGIDFNVAGETGYGFCRLCIPKNLMAPPYTVTIDNGQTPVTYYNETLFDNSTHRWIYFAYLHSEHQVEIIPEFHPSLFYHYS